MKKLLILAPVLLMAACQTPPKLPEAEVKIVDRVEYVIRIPPEELLTLPPMPANIDVDKASQATIAQWLLNNEAYINALRNRIIEIARFLKSEQVKLDEKAKEENINSLAGTEKK